MITDHELKYILRSRYGKSSADYARSSATQYAEKHAIDALPVIKSSIAQLYLRYVLESDAGEKALLRTAIDLQIEMGAICKRH